MALRYLARRVGIPALRQASGPRVTPSAGSGPLASRSSQAGYSSEKHKTQEMMERVVENNASLRLHDIMRARRRRRMIQRGMYMGSVAISLGLVAYTVAALKREMELLVRERDIQRELRETMEADLLMEAMERKLNMDDEEMGESNMDGDKKK